MLLSPFGGTCDVGVYRIGTCRVIYKFFNNQMFNTLTTGGCLMRHYNIAESSCRRFQQNQCAAFWNHLMSVYGLYIRTCACRIYPIKHSNALTPITQFGITVGKHGISQLSQQLSQQECVLTQISRRILM